MRIPLINTRGIYLSVRLATLILLTAFSLMGTVNAVPAGEQSSWRTSEPILDGIAAENSRERLPFAEDDIAVVALPDGFNPVHRILYFRQAVVDRYDGKHALQMDDENPVWEDVWPNFSAFYPVPVSNLRYRQPLSYRVRVIQKTTPLLLMDGSEIIEHLGDGLYQITAQVLDHKRPDIFRQLLAARAGFENVTDGKRYLQAPDDPRVRQLAEKALREYALDERGIRSDYLKALCMSRWLTEHGTLNAARQFDPMALFISRFAGNSIQFAQVAALMMRSIGLPSRVAYGYAVAAPEHETLTPLLIAEDAVSIWPEVHIRGFGWLPLQVCPPANDKERASLARGDKAPCY